MTQHEGGCHCGKVRFRIAAPADITVLDCTCTICQMIGYQHLIVPTSDFELTQGEDSLTLYTFNTGIAKHYFCSVCGIKSFYIPRSHPNDVSVNARCLDPGTVTSVTTKVFDDATRSIQD